MNIKISYLTEHNLNDLPEWKSFPCSCKYCRYWQSPHEFNADDKNERKKSTDNRRQWFDGVKREFGECGIIIYVDEKPIGFAQYAPPKFFSTVVHYPIIPSPDAVYISCLFIFEKKYRNQGFGTVLLNAILEDLEKRDIKTVETIARKNNPENPSGPVEFYLANKFIIYKDDKEFPLVRLEL